MSGIDNQPAGTREDMAERRVKAFELRKVGYSYRQIGRALGVSGKTAHADVQAVLAELAEQRIERAAEYVTMELERLDQLTLAAARVLQATHPFISGGKVVSRFTSDGVPIGLTDDGPRLQAIDRLLRISESRRKLLGLDAPTKIAATNPDGTAPAVYAELRTTVLALLPMEQRLLLADALDRMIDVTPLDRPSDEP